MPDAVEEQYQEKEWEQIRDSLDEVDTDYVADQLGVMGRAEVLYPDGSNYEWRNDIAEKYEQLVNGFGGEEKVAQYLEIDAKGVAVAVEYEDEPIFAIKALEPGYSVAEGPKIDLDAAI